jgi:hypothetical protein
MRPTYLNNPYLRTTRPVTVHLTRYSVCHLTSAEGKTHINTEVTKDPSWLAAGCCLIKNWREALTVRFAQISDAICHSLENTEKTKGSPKKVLTNQAWRGCFWVSRVLLVPPLVVPLIPSNLIVLLCEYSSIVYLPSNPLQIDGLSLFSLIPFFVPQTNSSSGVVCTDLRFDSAFTQGRNDTPESLSAGLDRHSMKDAPHCLIVLPAVMGWRSIRLERSSCDCSLH